MSRTPRSLTRLPGGAAASASHLSLVANPQPRVLLVANTSWYLHNFRLPLLQELRRQGYDVALLAPADGYTPRLQEQGFDCHPWVVARRSVNPLLEFQALVDLVRHYRRERPQLVHHFTIKACLYGTIAAKLAGVPRVINAVTGLGHVFVGDRPSTRVLRLALRPLYRAVFMARRAAVVFQNADDLEQLVRLGITDNSHARMIRSSGVDIEYFSPAAAAAASSDAAAALGLPLTPLGPERPARVLFPSRLIHQKGFSELLLACQDLWATGYAFELLVAGSLDDGNRSSLSAEQLERLHHEPRIRCLGHVDDMRALYAASDLVVLPSWREGLSRALIEAAAMEKAIITTDVPGCRDVIDNGRNGLLVSLRDPEALRRAIELLLLQPELARSFGIAARRKVVNEFRVGLVNAQTLEQYQQLLADGAPVPAPAIANTADGAKVIPLAPELPQRWTEPAA